MNPDITSQSSVSETASHDFRQMVEAAEIVVFTTVVDGYFTYVNPAVMPMLGYAPSEVCARHFTEFIAPEWRETVSKFYDRQYDHHIAKTVMEYSLTTASGQAHWVEQTVVLMTNGDQ